MSANHLDSGMQPKSILKAKSFEIDPKSQSFNSYKSNSAVYLSRLLPHCQGSLTQSNDTTNQNTALKNVETVRDSNSSDTPATHINPLRVSFGLRKPLVEEQIQLQLQQLQFQQLQQLQQQHQHEIYKENEGDSKSTITSEIVNDVDSKENVNQLFSGELIEKSNRDSFPNVKSVRSSQSSKGETTALGKVFATFHSLHQNFLESKIYLYYRLTVDNSRNQILAIAGAQLIIFMTIFFVNQFVLGYNLPSIRLYNLIHAVLAFQGKLLLALGWQLSHLVRKSVVAKQLLFSKKGIPLNQISNADPESCRQIIRAFLACLVCTELSLWTLSYFMDWVPTQTYLGDFDCVPVTYNTPWNFTDDLPTFIAANSELGLLQVFGLPITSGIIGGYSAIPALAPATSFAMNGPGVVFLVQTICANAVASQIELSETTAIRILTSEYWGQIYSFDLEIIFPAGTHAVAEYAQNDLTQKCEVSVVSGSAVVSFQYVLDIWDSITATAINEITINGSVSVTLENSAEVNFGQLHQLLLDSENYYGNVTYWISEGIKLGLNSSNLKSIVTRGSSATILNWGILSNGLYDPMKTWRSISAVVALIGHYVLDQYDGNDSASCPYQVLLSAGVFSQLIVVLLWFLVAGGGPELDKAVKIIDNPLRTVYYMRKSAERVIEQIKGADIGEISLWQHFSQVQVRFGEDKETRGCEIGRLILDDPSRDSVSALKLQQMTQSALDEIRQRLFGDAEGRDGKGVDVDQVVRVLGPVISDAAYVARFAGKTTGKTGTGKSGRAGRTPTQLLRDDGLWRLGLAASTPPPPPASRAALTPAARRLAESVFRFHGCDRRRRPCLVVTLANYSRDADSAAFTAALVHVLEVARRRIAYANRDSDSHVPLVLNLAVIVDLEGVGLNNINYELMPAIISLFYSHYPSIFGVLYVLNFGWLHSGIWSVVKRALSKEACEKLLFLTKPEMPLYFDPSFLLEEHGGTNTVCESPEIFEKFDRDTSPFDNPSPHISKAIQFIKSNLTPPCLDEKENAIPSASMPAITISSVTSHRTTRNTAFGKSPHLRPKKQANSIPSSPALDSFYTPLQSFKSPTLANSMEIWFDAPQEITQLLLSPAIPPETFSGASGASTRVAELFSPGMVETLGLAVGSSLTVADDAFALPDCAVCYDEKDSTSTMVCESIGELQYTVGTPRMMMFDNSVSGGCDGGLGSGGGRSSRGSTVSNSTAGDFVDAVALMQRNKKIGISHQQESGWPCGNCSCCCQKKNKQRHQSVLQKLSESVHILVLLPWTASLGIANFIADTATGRLFCCECQKNAMVAGSGLKERESLTIRLLATAIFTSTALAVFKWGKFSLNFPKHVGQLSILPMISQFATQLKLK
ncbi:hypothetical protein HK100_012490 [Physocladia obscura]|uniref:CRAL-TRIO domain-containing protein n=1 Tax=Physocladia obscura TaxID=109957 RepID=A0AAD5T2H0_9FUNG|nr:hypothetical protein HK100_012490 [Physocladia obscura]